MNCWWTCSLPPFLVQKLGPKMGPLSGPDTRPFEAGVPPRNAGPHCQKVQRFQGFLALVCALNPFDHVRLGTHPVDVSSFCFWPGVIWLGLFYKLGVNECGRVSKRVAAGIFAYLHVGALGFPNPAQSTFE